MSTTDPRPLWSLYGLTLGALLALAGCRTPGREGPTEPGRVAQAMAALEARADADSLAAAALLQVASDRDAALALAVQALEVDPNRPDLLWLTIRLCADAAACSPSKWDGRLEAVDRQNAAPHLDELRLAALTGDEDARQRALDAFARSEHLALYWTRLMARGTRAVLQTGALPPSAAQPAIESGLSVLIPPLQELSRQCKEEILVHPANRERCQRIAAVLQSGDTVIAEAVGVAIAKRAWPEDSAEWRAADRAHRVQEYRTAALSKDPQWTMHHAEQFIALGETNAREQDLMRQQLVLMGLPPDPPAP